MKKVLSLVLSLVLVLGLASVAFADATPDPKFSLGDANPAYEEITVGTDASVTIPLIKDTKDVVTRADVRTYKLSVRLRSIKGGSAIDKAEIVYTEAGDAGEASVKVTFADPLFNLKAVDFQGEVTLLKDKRVLDRENAAKFEGKLSNSTFPAYADDDVIFAEDGPIIEPTEYIRNAKIDAGNDVTLYGNLYKDSNVYVKAISGLSDKNQELLSKYPAIENVYRIKTIGFKGDVKLNAPEKMEVYILDAEGNLKHIGNTDDKLPLAEDYYVAKAELEIEGVDETPEEETPGMGGDDALPNINDNPSTGR